MDIIQKIIQFISLALVMLVTGVFWGTWFSLSRSISKISPETFLENGRMIIKNLAVPMRIMMPLTVLFMIVGACIYMPKNEIGFYLNVVAVLLMIITLLITVLIEVPIDNKIKTWTVASLPPNWETFRAKWQRFHTIRTFTAIGSFLLLLAGILFQ